VAVCVVAGETTRSVEDGERGVRIASNLHPRLDVMGAHAALRQLQPQCRIRHSIVASDDAFLLDAQRLGEEAGIGSNKDLLGKRRGLGEARIVLRQIDLADPSVGGLDVGDAGLLEFVASSIVTIRSSKGCPSSHACCEPSWCSIMPSYGFLSRLRRCAPRRFARSTSPAACNCVFVQV
jgi:hypothetical protein